MARIRSIKPDFFVHDGLAELSVTHRLLFIGLWTQADREGRMEDRPARIKVAVLPYDEVNVDALLQDLADHRERFVVRYAVDGIRYIQVRNFTCHQRPHAKESPSTIPAVPPQGGASHNLGDGSPRKPDNLGDGSPRKPDEASRKPDNLGDGKHARKGREGKGREGKEVEAEDAPSGASAAADPVADHAPDLAAAVAVCRAHPFLARMLDPAVVLAQQRAAYPELDLTQTVRRAAARLTPERIAEQERRGKGPDGFVAHFFGIAEAERQRLAAHQSAATDPNGPTTDPAELTRRVLAERGGRDWRTP